MGLRLLRRMGAIIAGANNRCTDFRRTLTVCSPVPFFGVAVVCITKRKTLVFVASPIALVGIAVAVAAKWRALIVVVIIATYAVGWFFSSPTILSNVIIVLISVVAITKTAIVELMITVSIAALLSVVTHLISY